MKSFSKERRFHGFCTRSKCNKLVANATKPRSVGIFGSIYCIEHNDEAVDFCWDILQKLEVKCFVMACDDIVQPITKNRFHFNHYCVNHSTNNRRSELPRCRYTVEELETLAKEKVQEHKKSFDKDVKLYIFTLSTTHSLTGIKNRGPSEIIFIETFMDFNESNIGSSAFMFEMMKRYQSKLLNVMGIGDSISPGKVGLFVAIFPKSTAQWQKTEGVANFILAEIKMERIKEIARSKIERIMASLMRWRTENGGAKFPLITCGASLNLESREEHYKKCGIYKDGIESLESDE